jgi:hypothetical protein
VQPAEKLLGRSLFELFPSSQAAQFHDFIQLALKTGQPVKTEYSLSIDGAQTWFSATISPMLEDQVVWVARDITEQRRADAVQSALYRIAEITGTAQDMPSFFAAMHRIIGELMYAQNMYVALYDPATDLLSYPYWVDETEPAPKPEHPGRSLTGMVLRTSSRSSFRRRAPKWLRRRARSAGRRRSIGWASLKRGEETFGVLSVQAITRRFASPKDRSCDVCVPEYRQRRPAAAAARPCARAKNATAP